MTLLAAICLVAGCAASGAPSKKESTMSPEESRLAIVKLYAETIAALGTTGWESIGQMSPTDCHLDGGSTGAFYPDSDIAMVEKLWKSKGIQTTVKRSSNKLDTTVRLIGVGGPVDSVEFDADTARTSLDGNSVCVVGNAEKIINKQDGEG
jgi:hypothetical protein